MLSEGFFLSQDNDSHWYVIPVCFRAEWEKFLNIPSEDEASWNVPRWALMVDGPHRVVFPSFKAA